MAGTARRSLDHLVGAGEQRRRNRKAERFRGLEGDNIEQDGERTERARSCRRLCASAIAIDRARRLMTCTNFVGA
jgi:hypothetical protein